MSAVLIRLAEALRGRGLQPVYRRLMESQWWPPDCLRALQEEKLADRLRDALAGSPLLGERLRQSGVAGAGPVPALASLPILEREDFQRRGRELHTPLAGTSRALANSTGGSTGSNIHFWVDRECWRMRDAVDLRLWSFLGLAPGARILSVWGAPMDVTSAQRWRERLRLFLENRRLVSAYALAQADADAILEWIDRRRPDVVMGYASVLDYLARRAMERGGLPGPSWVVASAEVLLPHQRERIQQAWGGRVCNLYGAREVGLIAMECEQGAGLHVMDERLIVERDDAVGLDGAGDLLITDLDNRATPFLRYRIGDQATPGLVGPCACGRGLSRLGEIRGRSFDIIRGPSGRAVGGTFWSLLLRTAVAGIDRFQVVQVEPDLLRIRLAPPGGLSDEGRDVVVTKVREALGLEMRVEFQEEETLRPLPSGKHRFVVALDQERR